MPYPFVKSATLLAAVLAGATLAGCAGHGAHTSAAITGAQERLTAFKAGVEWDMARQQFLAGELDKALRTADRALAMNPSVAKSHVLRARILMEMGRLEDARESLLRARAVDPAHVDAHYYEGVLLERLSDPAGALERYLAAMDLDEGNPQHPLAAAEMLIETGRPDAAEALLQSRRARFEHNAGIRQTLGHLALMRSEPDHAADLFNEARLLAPDDLVILEDLARAQALAGRFGEAEFNLSRVLDADQARNRRDLLHLRARCLIELNRPLEARDILLGLTRDKAGAVDAAAWSDLGRLALRLNDHARVTLAANRLIALQPDKPDGRLLLASLKRAQGDLASALAIVDQAASLASADAATLKLRGLILRDLGRNDDAAQSLARALQMSPDDRQTRELLASVETASASGSQGPREGDE